MEFTVVKKTANGNLLLTSKIEGKPLGIERMHLYRARKKVATVFDTIASIDKPFYLAKSLEVEINEGETLYDKKHEGERE